MCTVVRKYDAIDLCFLNVLNVARISGKDSSF
jgi:hypothetical protein